MLCSANRSSVPLETQERASRKVTKSPDLGCYKLSNMSETDFWRECPQIFSDPEVVHGAPVFKGTRLPAQTIADNIDGYLDEGLSLDEAIAETLDNFPTVPNGADGIRALLRYRAAREHQLQF